MASVFLYHVVGDLTVGKPELSEFSETETVAAAIGTIADSSEGGIPVWRRAPKGGLEDSQGLQQRFVGILSALDIVAFLAREEWLVDQEKAINTAVSEVVVPNNSALKVVDPGTRFVASSLLKPQHLIDGTGGISNDNDALEMMKQGVKRLVIPKSSVWRGMSKRFSILYNGRWLRNADPSAGNNIPNALHNPNLSSPQPLSSTSPGQNKFCCLSREDILRFLIGCLGALAPLPLTSIASLGAINVNYCSLEASCPAIDAIKNHPRDVSAVAVVEPTSDRHHKMIGEISEAKLWKCDYLAAAWAMANLSSRQFVMGIEDHMVSRSQIDIAGNGTHGETNSESSGAQNRLTRFGSRSISFLSNLSNPSLGASRGMYSSRGAPLTCKATSSLAAVMAQMLSHRATHVWVTETDRDDALVGVLDYTDILAAVTRHPSAAAISETQS